MESKKYKREGIAMAMALIIPITFVGGLFFGAAASGLTSGWCRDLHHSTDK